MTHAASTIIELAKSGANLDVGPGQAASTVIEIAQIVAGTGAHATIDLSKPAAATVQEVARFGGRNVTVKL
jgi:hypothetical protein